MVQTLLLAGLALAGVALCLVLGIRLRRVSGPARRRDGLDGVAEASTAPTPDLPVAGGAAAAPVVAAPVVAVVAERTAGAPVAAVAPAPAVVPPVAATSDVMTAGMVTPQAPVPPVVRRGGHNDKAARFARPVTGAGRPAASRRITGTVAVRW